MPTETTCPFQKSEAKKIRSQTSNLQTGNFQTTNNTNNSQQKKNPKKFRSQTSNLQTGNFQTTNIKNTQTQHKQYKQHKQQKPQKPQKPQPTTITQTHQPKETTMEPRSSPQGHNGETTTGHSREQLRSHRGDAPGHNGVNTTGGNHNGVKLRIPTGVNTTTGHREGNRLAYCGYTRNDIMWAIPWMRYCECILCFTCMYVLYCGMFYNKYVWTSLKTSRFWDVNHFKNIECTYQTDQKQKIFFKKVSPFFFGSKPFQTYWMDITNHKQHNKHVFKNDILKCLFF